jgi:predicted permease
MSRSFRLPFRSRARIASEIDEELAFHLKALATRLEREGWPAAEADAEARRRFGDIEFTKYYCRTEDLRREGEKRRMTIADELKQDLRYALRGLRASPVFAVVALATLGLGIGANTAIFSVVRGVLLAPLPFTTPDRIVRVWNANPADRIERGPYSEPDFLDLRAATRLTETIGGFFFAEQQSGVDLTGMGAPERLSSALVTPGFFETLRPRPLLGRVLLEEEHQTGRSRSAVIGYGLWQRRFGGDPSILNKTITLSGEPYTIVGIMRPEFTYPASQALDVWMPLSYFGPDYIGRVRGARFLSVIARLKPGVTPEQFRTEAAGVAARLAHTYPDNPTWDNATVLPIRDSIVGEVRRPLLVLVAAVALVLLITCVNIASLLLARASARQREIAVRAALGAGRGRIIRQLFTESLTLALAGGALGTGLAYVAVRALVASGGAQLPGAGDLGIDGVVLAFTVVVSVLSGLLFGALPAFRANGPELEQALRAGSRGSVGAQGQRMRSALVVAEVALAVILVVGASLAAKSFARLLSVKPGFDPTHALVARVTVPSVPGATPAQMTNYYSAVLDAVRRVPGVVAAGSVRDLPTRGNGESRRADQFSLPGAVQGKGAPFQMHHISTDYFKAMGVPLRAGREFLPTDRAGAPVVFIVNEELARRYWPNESAVGKILRIGTTNVEIVGVVGNMRQRGLSEPVEPAMYIHALQNLRSGMSIVVRTTGDPLRLTTAVRDAIWTVDRNVPISEMTTLEHIAGSAVARPKLLAWLLGIFGAIGLLLGALGIYGLLSFAVTQRRQEIGVRVALGAPQRSVLRLIVGQGMLLATSGVIIGVLGARLLTRQMQAVLFDIAPTDPGTFVQVVGVLLATALLASWFPARRALGIDPVTALRYD